MVCQSRISAGRPDANDFFYFAFAAIIYFTMKKLIWIALAVLLGLGIWKAGVYFYHQMEQEEAKRNMMMEKQSNSAAEGYVNPAASALEQKARNLERKTREVEQEEGQ